MRQRVLHADQKQKSIVIIICAVIAVIERSYRNGRAKLVKTAFVRSAERYLLPKDRMVFTAPTLVDRKLTDKVLRITK